MFCSGTPVVAWRFFLVSSNSCCDSVREPLPDSARTVPIADVIGIPNRAHRVGSISTPMILVTTPRLPALKHEALTIDERIATVHKMTWSLERLVRFRLSIKVASHLP